MRAPGGEVIYGRWGKSATDRSLSLPHAVHEQLSIPVDQDLLCEALRGRLVGLPPTAFAVLEFRADADEPDQARGPL